MVGKVTSGDTTPSQVENYHNLKMYSLIEISYIIVTRKDYWFFFHGTRDFV